MLYVLCVVVVEVGLVEMLLGFVVMVELLCVVVCYFDMLIVVGGKGVYVVLKDVWVVCWVW